MWLSVLTPSLGYGRFLADAIASVTAQSGAGTEHVVADGGSTDETVDVLGAAGDRVRWRSEPDLGQSDALNRALAMSSGEWIGWLNADEFYLPGALEALLATLARHPDADLVHGDALFVDAGGRVIRLVAQHSFSRRVLRWNRCNISSCAMFVRREAIPERGWDTRLSATMDWDLYLEVEERGGQIDYLPRPLGAFRVHSAQITAEPLPAAHPDFEHLRRAHGLPAGAAAAVANRVGELEHRMLKVVEGGLGREVRVRRLRGSDVRWFRSPEAWAAADAVIAAGTPRRHRVDGGPVGPGDHGQR